MRIQRLRIKHKILLGLALFGDLIEEVKDAGGLTSMAYENMYGFVPQNYKQHNFYAIVGRLLKTSEISKTIRDNKVFLVTSNKEGAITSIFPLAKLREGWDKKLRIVIFDIEELNRRQRGMLRSKLKELGFGMWQRSVWVSPLSIEKELREFLDTYNLSSNAFVFTIFASEAGDLVDFSAQIWKTKKLNKEYMQWIEEVKSGNISFEVKDRFWKILIKDPFLPRSFLPKEWKGEEAMQIFKKVFIQSLKKV